MKHSMESISNTSFVIVPVLLLFALIILVFGCTAPEWTPYKVVSQEVLDPNTVIQVIPHPVYGTHMMLVPQGAVIGDRVVPEDGVYLCRDLFEDLLERLARAQAEIERIRPQVTQDRL